MKSRAMRVAIDLLPLSAGKMGGTETVVRETLNACFHLFPDHHFILLVRQKEQLANTGIEHSANVELVEQPDRHAAFWLSSIPKRLRTALRVLGSGMSGSYAAQCARWHEALIEHCRIDRYLFPFTNHPVYALSCPSVVMVYDPQHDDFPQMLPGVRSQRALSFQPSFKHADAVLTMTQFVKDRLIALYGLSEACVHVIGAGPMPAVPPGGLPFQKTGPFVFYPANTWPHKNHKVLLRAVRRAIDAFAPDLKLVLTGSEQRFSAYAELIQERDRLHLQEQVMLLGYVSMAEIAACYREALALVFPSRYEGFGLPVLEAMRQGCPVVCSTAAALREVAGNAALYFDPDDEVALVAAIQSIYACPSRREDLIGRGRQRSREFSWTSTASRIMRVLDHVNAVELKQKQEQPEYVVPVCQGRVFDGTSVSFRLPGFCRLEASVRMNTPGYARLRWKLNNRIIGESLFSPGRMVGKIEYENAETALHDLHQLNFQVCSGRVQHLQNFRALINPAFFTLESLRVFSAEGYDHDLLDVKGAL